MKKLISSIAIVALVGMMVITAVKAADTATVTATVTVQHISVTVSDGSISYGTIPLNTSKSTCDIPDTQTVTNNGNVVEDFRIKGQNSSPGNWTLGTSPGNETYVHEFSTSSCPWTSGTPLSTDYKDMAANIAAGGTVTLNLRITTPTATTQYDAQSVNVTVQATAHQ